MSALTDDGSRVIEREIDLVSIHRRGKDKKKTLDEINSEYEIDKCVDFIKSHKDTERVALQLPDELLGDATAIQGSLRKQCPAVLFFVMADTLFAPCCVDDITAQHTKTNLILKFGNSCHTKTVGVPICYIPLFVNITEENLQIIKSKINEIPHTTKIISSSMKRLFPNDSAPIEKSETVSICDAHITGNQVLIIGYTPGIALEASLWYEYKRVSKDEDETDPEVHFITETGTVMSVAETPEYLLVSKRLRSRNFLLEKIKDVEVITLVAISLNIAGYADVIEKLKELIIASGKQVVVVYVGKPNVPKLANYEESDLFCVVACPQSTWFDTKEYPKPVVTPMEIAIALGEHISDDDEWNPFLNEEYYTLNLEAVIRSFKNSSAIEPDTSLLTGAIRGIRPDWQDNPNDETETTVVEDEEGSLVTYQSKQVALFQETPLVSRLHARSYQGLERTEAPIQTEIAKGLHGVAAEYVPVE